MLKTIIIIFIVFINFTNIYCQENQMQKEERLAKEYAPILLFHHEENIFPSNPDLYFDFVNNKFLQPAAIEPKTLDRNSPKVY